MKTLDAAGRRRTVAGTVPPRHRGDGTMVLRIVSFNPLTAGESDWARFHTYRHARRAESDPDEPVLSDAEVEEDERQRHPRGTTLPCSSMTLTSVWAVTRPSVPARRS
jgi:hypothetical protein